MNVTESSDDPNPPLSIPEENEILSSASFQITEFPSYEDVKPYWEELNRSYKGDELTLDWKAHDLIWRHFYQQRGAVLKVLAGFENGRCVGVFPLIWMEKDPLDPPRWSLSDDFIISREYFSPPEKVLRLIALLPPHYSDDLSCFYIPEQAGSFMRSPGGVVDLKGAEAEYLDSLRKKSRHTLKRTRSLNADLRVETDSRIRWDEIQPILKLQLDYWVQKNGVISTDYAQYSRDKIATDLVLMARAEEMGKLIALYFYDRNSLIAVNFSVRREADRVDDYLCLRDCREQNNWRGLGIFAILTNMDLCRGMGIRWYDLSSCVKEYKKKFINMESSFYYREYPGYSLPAETGGPDVYRVSPHENSPSLLDVQV